jgi:phosphoribosylformylglycinamidine synthase
MLQLHGPPALSAFRIQKLLGRLNALDGAVTGVAAGFMHFVDLEAPLSAQERSVLDALLRYGPRRGRAERARGAAHRHHLAVVEQGD